VCSDCGVAHDFARGAPAPPRKPLVSDAELAAGLDLLRRHDAAMLAADDG